MTTSPDLFVLLFINPEMGRVALGGVFTGRHLADSEARRLCPEGSYWNIVETLTNLPLPAGGDEPEGGWFRVPAIPEDERCPACGGCGLNEERTAKCSECKGKGHQ